MKVFHNDNIKQNSFTLLKNPCAPPIHPFFHLSLPSRPGNVFAFFMNGGKASTSKVAEVVCYLRLPPATSFPTPRGASVLTQADPPAAHSQAFVTPPRPNSKGLKTVKGIFSSLLLSQRDCWDQHTHEDTWPHL